MTKKRALGGRAHLRRIWRRSVKKSALQLFLVRRRRIIGERERANLVVVYTNGAETVRRPRASFYPKNISNFYTVYFSCIHTFCASRASLSSAVSVLQSPSRKTSLSLLRSLTGTTFSFPFSETAEERASSLDRSHREVV